MPPYFDDAEERKAGPVRHTAEQLRVIACRHEVRVGRGWWKDQAALAAELEAQPVLARGQQDRLRRLAVHCTQCEAVLIVRYTTRPAMRIVLVADAEVRGGEIVDEAAGEVVDERDLPAPLPAAGVIDEAEFPVRSRRK